MSEEGHGRGRPRQWPEGTTAADRKAHARRRLKAAGGHVFQVELGPGAWEALQRMAAPGERGELLERLILQEHQRRTRAATE